SKRDWSSDVCSSDLVMGKNLDLNVKNHGYSVSGFSIDKPEVDALAKYEDKNLKPTYTWEEFVNSLEKPRKILIQIMAGKPVDERSEERRVGKECRSR